MGKEGLWEQLYFWLLNGDSVQNAKPINRFLYSYKGCTWQFIIFRELHIKRMAAQKFRIQQAYDNRGYRGFNQTYQNVADKY